MLNQSITVLGEDGGLCPAGQHTALVNNIYQCVPDGGTAPSACSAGNRPVEVLGMTFCVPTAFSASDLDALLSKGVSYACRIFGWGCPKLPDGSFLRPQPESLPWYEQPLGVAALTAGILGGGVLLYFAVKK